MLESTDGTYFDQDLQYLDFCKIENFKWTALFYKLRGREQQFMDLVDEVANKIEDYEEKERFKDLAHVFGQKFSCSIGPLCAFVGGKVAQEIVKAITGKFSPANQFFYYDAIEVLPEFE